MSFIKDVVKTVDSSAETTAEVKEAMGILMSLAETKGKAFKEEIEADLITGKTIDNLTVAITKALAFDIQCRAGVKITVDGLLTKIGGELGKIFSGDAKILDGIAGIAQDALTAIMGSGEGQELEQRKYTVVVEYPAIVRYDFAFWGRNISSTSIKKYVENVFTCVAYKSAVDISKLAFNDFLAVYGPILRAAYGSNPEKMKEMIQQAQEIYALFFKKETSQKYLSQVIQAKTLRPGL